MDNTSPHISVIILNWNGWQDTIECLETVLKNNYQNYHIFLIDNFSEDDSITRIRQWATGDWNMGIETNFPDLIYPLVKKPVRLFELNLELNIDPEEQLVKQSWENIVTACAECNHRKGGRTLQEANMSLRRVPFDPPTSAQYLFEHHLSRLWLLCSHPDQIH